MTGGRPNTWTDRDRAKLLRLHKGKNKWGVIARILDRSIGSCFAEHRRLVEVERDNVRKIRTSRARRVVELVLDLPAGQAPPTVPEPRQMALSRLQASAELLARIQHDRGLTAGLLGDPPAGRSALDQKRAGLVQAALGVRGVRVLPNITLPTGPFHERS
jgi:hypothetical protein